ncbi:DUF222 domain-containing protein [Actinopolymorpha sp. B11F2]|uniref:HNH endonuclease signature motif containing protein n=1 Tax=Actinopolymorpha sp. B11F2 TaxID=3160862 RepID=UPI0032E3BDCF
MFDHGGVDFSVLASAAPGAELGAVLAGIDTAAVNGHARVIVLQAWERQASWVAARFYESMAHVARSPACTPDSPPELNRCFGEFASAEVGAALGLSPRCADRELSFAFELTERLPATRAALTTGRISLAKTRAISEETCCLAPELAAQAEDFILAADAAAGIGLTRAQLVRRLRRKVLELDPDGAEERRREAQQGRRIRFGAGVDGTGSIYGLDLPLAGTAAAQVFIKTTAKRIKTAGDVRTLAQIEADVLLDLLRGRQPTPPHADAAADVGESPAHSRADAENSWDDPGDGGQYVETGDEALVAKVELVADLETWLGLGDKAGELAGLGAVSPQVIGEIKNAAAGGFEYCRTVTIDGKVVFHQASSRRYRPTATQRRLVQARHRVCTHPGCSRPAVSCDLDHVVEHRLGGPSCACNLAPLCRRHHRAKHEAGWFWTQNSPGELTAQSPLGHTYTIQPEPPPGE